LPKPVDLYLDTLIPSSKNPFTDLDYPELLGYWIPILTTIFMSFILSKSFIKHITPENTKASLSHCQSSGISPENSQHESLKFVKLKTPLPVCVPVCVLYLAWPAEW